jgi:hypothetical protein
MHEVKVWGTCMSENVCSGLLGFNDYLVKKFQARKPFLSEL